MRVWTVQPKSVIDKLRTEKVLHTEISKSNFRNRTSGFKVAYYWLANYMKENIPIDSGIEYPWWAWDSLDKALIFLNNSSEHSVLELEIEEDKILVSDFESWSLVINGDNLSDINNTNSEDEILNSWYKIFYKNECSKWEFLQYNFWELRYDDIIEIIPYKEPIKGNLQRLLIKSLKQIHYGFKRRKRLNEV